MEYYYQKKILQMNGGCRIMKVGFGGGIIVGALLGATISIMAEENFNFNRCIKAMNRAGRNISRCTGRLISSINRMI